jgi:hypothetical protein
VVFVPVAAVVSGALFCRPFSWRWRPELATITPSLALGGATNPRAPGDDASKSKHLVVPSLCRARAQDGKTPAFAPSRRG